MCMHTQLAGNRLGMKFVSIFLIYVIEMQKNKRTNSVFIIKLILLILLQIVFIYGLFATVVEFIVLLTYPGYHSPFWDLISYFVLAVMAVSLVYSIALTKQRIKDLQV